MKGGGGQSMNRMGDFFIEIGAMTKDQVERVLILQRKGDTRFFGEIALELGYLNEESIRRYIDHLEMHKENIVQRPTAG